MKVKRILSLVLSLVIMLGAATVSAFAEDENINVTEIIGDSVLETDIDAPTVLDESDLINTDTIDEVPVTEEISIPEITEEENKVFQEKIEELEVDKYFIELNDKEWDRVEFGKVTIN